MRTKHYILLANTLQKNLVNQSKECANKFKECKDFEDEAIAYVARYYITWTEFGLRLDMIYCIQVPDRHRRRQGSARCPSPNISGKYFLVFFYTTFTKIALLTCIRSNCYCYSVTGQICFVKDS